MHLALRAIGLCTLLSVSTAANAVEGFPDALANLRPDLHPTCATCHELGAAATPNNTNVKPAGYAYYQDLMDHEAVRNKALPTFADYLGAADFAIYGDTRSQANIHREIMQMICADNPSFALHTGDMVADGSKSSQWQEALAIEACLINDKRILHACGNHEGGGCTNNAVRDALGYHDAYYTAERAGFTFLILNANRIDRDQMAGLKALPVGPKYIPVYHQAPYPTMSAHGADSGIINNFVPEFKRLGVKLAFNGHNHGYDRAYTDGIMYVTVGGGGAPLYPCGSYKSYTQICVSDYSYARCAVQGNRVDCNTKRRGGSIIDQFSVVY